MQHLSILYILCILYSLVGFSSRNSFGAGKNRGIIYLPVVATKFNCPRRKDPALETSPPTDHNSGRLGGCVACARGSPRGCNSVTNCQCHTTAYVISTNSRQELGTTGSNSYCYAVSYSYSDSDGNTHSNVYCYRYSNTHCPYHTNTRKWSITGFVC